MPYAEECERPFYVQPSILLKTSLAPSVACGSNALNSLVRGFVFVMAVCGVLSLVYGPSIFVFGFVVVTALYAPSLYATFLRGAPEGFEASVLRKEDTVLPVKQDGIGVQPTETRPSARNPFMNVLINEIKYNPERPPAQDINDPTVKAQLDDFFRVQWTSDPTDVFGRSQSQREFYTMPSTSIPNDQASYQDWLYKIPGKTCKEGGRNCVGGTDGSPIPWLNSDR